MPTKERLIDKLRDELYARHGWTGETAVKNMVPIILGIRHIEARAIAGGKEEAEAMTWALMQLKDGGKRELDTTLTQVSREYNDVGPLLREALDTMITFVGKQTDGVIHDIFEYLGSNPDLLQSLRDEDFIGTLFERSVSDAFRGDDGRFFTPRNVILIIREMMRMLLKKRDKTRPISSYTVCDPCCGSARFLIYWSELILEEIREGTPSIKRPKLFKELKRIAQKTLFGADIHSETAAYGCLNMALHGDGATNITEQDSLDHFGFLVDMPLLRKFAEEFHEKWAAYSGGPARRRADLAPFLKAIDEMAGVVQQLADTETLDLSQKKWLNLIKLIRNLLEVDRRYPTQWHTIRAMQRRFKRQAVFETMLDDWSRRNHSLADGMDIIISNPPFGREQNLMMSDPYVLCQYRLATEVWVRDMSKGMVEKVIVKSLSGDQAIHEYYLEVMEEHFSKSF
jgi:N-6 DNA Methylase